MGDILGFNSFSGPLVLGTGVLVVVGKQSGGQTKGRWRAGITEISTTQGRVDHIMVLLIINVPEYSQRRPTELTSSFTAVSH